MNDLRYAFRQLLKNPGFTAVAVLTFALGIGANTAIFQLLDAVRMRSLPVAKPENLVAVRIAGGNRSFGVSQGANSEMTYALWEMVRQNAEPFSAVFAWGNAGFRVGEGAQARGAEGLWVSGEFFPVLGVRPTRGRLFTPEEDRRGIRPQGVVISYGYWQRAFAGAEDVVGKPLTIYDKSFIIIGVTPPEFFGLEVGKNFDLALPITARAIWSPDVLEQRHAWWITVMGRLKPGWTVERAAKYLDVISPGIFEATVPSGYANAALERYRTFRLTAAPAGKGVSRLRAEYERPLWLLLGITGLVLLIACTNLANLLLARASARERESAMRLAIGASRRRLLIESLSESFVLAGMGALLGAAVASGLSQALIWFLNTEGNALNLEMQTDWRLFAFLGAIAVLTCIVFGLAPALRSSSAEPAGALKSGGRGLTGGADRFRFQRGLVVSQVALSLVLLAGALLLVRSFWNLARIDPGFGKTGLVFGGVDFSRLKLPAERNELGCFLGSGIPVFRCSFDFSPLSEPGTITLTVYPAHHGREAR